MIEIGFELHLVATLVNVRCFPLAMISQVRREISIIIVPLRVEAMTFFLAAAFDIRHWQQNMF